MFWVEIGVFAQAEQKYYRLKYYWRNAIKAGGLYTFFYKKYFYKKV